MEKNLKVILEQVDKLQAAVDKSRPAYADMDITERIDAVSHEIGTLEADVSNPEYNSKYTSLAKLLEHLKPLLKKYGIKVIRDIEPVSGPEGERLFILKSYYQEVEVDDIEYAHSFQLPLIGVKMDDAQSLAAALTYSRRITDSIVFNLATEMDDDANSISPTEKRKKRTPRKTAPEKPQGAVLKDRDFEKQMDLIQSADSKEEANDYAIRLKESFALTEDQDKQLQEVLELVQ
jgi:hypothetical protein